VPVAPVAIRRRCQAFVGLSDADDDRAWRDLADLLGPAESAVVAGACAGIVQRGERPLLHVLASNRSAIALYERLGFVVRRSVQFEVVQPPVTR